MIVGVPKEAFPGERRVALVPVVVPNLMKAGFQVLVEAGAGASAGYPDADYVEKGAKLAASRAEVFQSADIIVQVLSYGSNDATGKDDLALFRRDQTVIGFHRPFGSHRICAATRRHRSHLLFRGIDAAHHPRAKHGRALLHGHDLRL